MYTQHIIIRHYHDATFVYINIHRIYLPNIDQNKISFLNHDKILFSSLTVITRSNCRKLSAKARWNNYIGNNGVWICQVVTTLGPVKPQRLASGHASSTEASEARETGEVQEMEIEQEMRALLSSSSPVKSHPSNMAGTPPHKLCLETSFTSLQSPSEFPQAGRELSVDSRGIPWEYVSLASELLNTPRADESKS